MELQKAKQKGRYDYLPLPHLSIPYRHVPQSVPVRILDQQSPPGQLTAPGPSCTCSVHRNPLAAHFSAVPANAPCPGCLPRPSICRTQRRSADCWAGMGFSTAGLSLRHIVAGSFELVLWPQALCTGSPSPYRCSFQSLTLSTSLSLCSKVTSWRGFSIALFLRQHHPSSFVPSPCFAFLQSTDCFPKSHTLPASQAGTYSKYGQALPVPTPAPGTSQVLSKHLSNECTI